MRLHKSRATSYLVSLNDAVEVGLVRLSWCRTWYLREKGASIRSSTDSASSFYGMNGDCAACSFVISCSLHFVVHSTLHYASTAILVPEVFVIECPFHSLPERSGMLVCERIMQLVRFNFQLPSSTFISRHVFPCVSCRDDRYRMKHCHHSWNSLDRSRRG